MTEITTGGIHQAMFNITKAVPTLEKLGEGPATQGKYKFLGIDDMMKALKPLFVAEQVQVYPMLVNHESRFDSADPAVNLKGEPVSDGRVRPIRVHEVVLYSFTFVFVPDGSSVTVYASGEAFDSSDKSHRKATTSAWKTALIQTFAIITGEPDPDSVDGAEAPAAKEAKPDRGQQMAAKAKATAPKDSTPEEPQPAAEKRSVTTNPRAALAKDEPEAVESPAAVEVDKLDAIKARARVAIEGLGIERVKVDEIGKAITGQERAKWINSIPLAGKVATELERLLAVQNAPADEPRGDEDPNAGDGL